MHLKANVEYCLSPPASYTSHDWLHAQFNNHDKTGCTKVNLMAGGEGDCMIALT